MVKEIKTFKQFLRDKSDEPGVNLPIDKLKKFAQVIETKKLPETIPLMMSYLERTQFFNDEDFHILKDLYTAWIDQEHHTIIEMVKEERGEV